MSIFELTTKRIRFYNHKISKYFSSINFSQDNYLLVIGGITGLLGGIGAIIFHEAIDFIEHTFFHAPGEIFGSKSLLDNDSIGVSILIILIPAIGGLLVGLLAHFFEKGEKGEGIPNVITAVASKGGVIKGAIAIKKIIGSALSIGTGGAGGKEGPIVQIGASIASSFGRFLNLSQDRLKILVGCGAAAGLSAAFNAPLGGAIFAMEIILRTFRARTFSPIIISSVIATALSRGYLGNEPAFSIAKYDLVSNVELIFYVVLGLLSGLAAIYFVRVFYFIEDMFGKLDKIPPYLKPAFGGLLVGIIGLYLPGVYGFSYESINGVLANNLDLVIVIALLIMKPIATAFTIGSGGNGGTFAPSLFAGAMLGGAFGQIVGMLFPELTAPAGAYALVGMAAVVAGTTHASLTALIMTFEMTNNYKIILPLMLTIIIATTVSKSVLKGSLYTIKFIREGKEIDIYGRQVNILKNITVKTLVEKKFDVIKDNFSWPQILEYIKNAKYNTILVQDARNRLVGTITFQNIRDVIMDEDTKHIRDFIIARDVMTEDIISVEDSINGEKAIKLIDEGDLEYLPIIDKSTKEILGIVSRQDLLNKYQKELFLQQSDENEMRIG